jgi:hypothetical protein
MSSLAEIEEAIERLPPNLVDELAVWLEHRRLAQPTIPEPDFLARAKTIWGDSPAGEPLSKLVSDTRN